jgi:hypothetical protein
MLPREFLLRLWYNNLMDSPESPHDPEETTPEEPLSVSLLTAIGSTALSGLFIFNTVDLAHYGWEIEAPAIVASSLFALGTAFIGAHEWVKFHRFRAKHQ